MEKKPILVVEDDPSMRMALSESLVSCGYAVETAQDGVEALGKFRPGSYELVITDMRMPKMGGMEVIKGVKKVSPETPVIVMTAYGTVNTAVEAMKEGAADFVMKPFSLDDIEIVVKNVIETSDRRDRTQGKEEAHGHRHEIITADKKMSALLELLRSVAKSRSSILIQGESGTGKELLARYIHQHSRRNHMPFIAVNCAAIPHTLLESEMFGYEKGAFTGAAQRRIGKFELADGGSILLDEVSEMDVQLQAKLLRVVQESEIDRLGGKDPIPVDVRIISTTNADLKKKISEKEFREDLYYRLNVVPVKVPPLRERKGDIPLLCDFFLEKYGKLNGRKKPRLSEEIKALLENYPWPGNVRELENVIERAVLVCNGETILPHHLFLEEDKELSTETSSGGGQKNSGSRQTLTLREMEKTLIFETLDRVGGNKTRASQILGISIRTMRNKLNEYKNEQGMTGESSF